MGTKSRETIYGASVRAAAERATEARKEADRPACEAWNKRMLAFRDPAANVRVGNELFINRARWILLRAKLGELLGPAVLRYSCIVESMYQVQG
jgi:hypothetical protein